MRQLHTNESHSAFSETVAERLTSGIEETEYMMGVLDGIRLETTVAGNVDADGDTVTLIKDLKVRGSSQVIKQGTKVRGIRVVGGDHDVEGKVAGSAMMLKSEFLKKV